MDVAAPHRRLPQPTEFCTPRCNQVVCRPMNPSVRGILFDLGGTLIDFGRVDVDALFEAGARLAYAYLQQLGQPLPPFVKYRRSQYRAIRWNYFKSCLTGREFNALELLADLGGKMEHDLSRTQYLELAWQWYLPLSKIATVEPDLPKTLAQIASGGVKLGLVSNTFIPSEVLDRHLADEKLLDPLPVRVYSSQVQYRKPHSKIFRFALAGIGLGASETMFVGDSLKADIRGANRAGMISVLKDPVSRHDRAGIVPAHRICKLAELPQIVARYNRQVQ